MQQFLPKKQDYKTVKRIMKNRIETYSELYDLVELDNTNDKLKQIAEFFLVAMNDWPRYNQERIENFIKELKEYFGSPLSLERIDAKKLDFYDEDVWKHESGSSICEMIELSKLYYDVLDFDIILKKILDYYGELEIK